jgi:hypothetical protein
MAPSEHARVRRPSIQYCGIAIMPPARIPSRLTSSRSTGSMHSVIFCRSDPTLPRSVARLPHTAGQVTRWLRQLVDASRIGWPGAELYRASAPPCADAVHEQLKSLELL